MSPTSNARRPSGAQPQTATRRSARQERIARRHPERELRSASTSGRRGPSRFVLFTAGALLAGLAIAGVAFFLTGGSGGLPLTAVKTPGFVTAANIQQTGTSGMILGNPDAKVTIDLWEDYQCTGCGSWTRSQEADLERDYVATGKVKVVYHDYLIIDEEYGGTESLDAANAARCAGDLGKYWQFHDWLFFNQTPSEKSGQYARDRLLEAGRQVGLDMTQFTTCVDNGRHKAEAQAESAKTPVTSTPGIFVNGTQVLSPSGPQYSPTYEQLKEALDKAVANPNPSPSASTSSSPSSSGSPNASASPTASGSATASGSPSPSASGSASSSASPAASPSPTASATS